MKFLTPTKSFLFKCRRVWQVLKKPTRKEFETVAKVSAIGILIIGAIGFFISIAMKVFIS
ncbi:MAG: protein translocase SEC61 complex subunit gamma [archaeon]